MTGKVIRRPVVRHVTVRPVLPDWAGAPRQVR